MADPKDPPGGSAWSASVSARLSLGGAASAVRPVVPAAETHQWLVEAVRHHQQGRLAEAEQLYRQIFVRDPNHAQALDFLGLIAHHFGRSDHAVQLISRAIMIDGRVSRFHMDLAIALKALGRMEEAVKAAQRGVDMTPEAGYYSNLGTILQDMGRSEEAEAVYRRAIALDPNIPEAHNNLGAVLQDMEQYDEAVKSFRRALQLQPDFADGHGNIAAAFHALGQLDEALPFYARAIALKPYDAVTSSNRLLCLTYSAELSAQALLAEHRDWDRRHGAVQKVPTGPFANSRDPERRLRIGYVSADMRTHPVGFFMLNVLATHNPAAVETFCYSHTPVPDEVTERLRAASGHWRQLIGVSDAEAVAMIRKDQIDILIDLSGHTANHRLLLFCQRAAPVQASWLGYPGTTGLSSIDYLIMDEAAVPQGAEQWCSEAVVRLPHVRFCYAPPDYAPAAADPPSGPGRPITFGSFNNLTKLGPQVVRLWTSVLKATPGSRLVLKWKSLTKPETRDRLIQAFADAGLEPGRLELRDKSPHPEMLAEYGDIDIALDPFPFCGGLTSCEALWMGVPVVTLPGDRPASRQTLGFLNVLGLDDELAARSEADYVRIATDLAADPDRRAELRRSLRPLMASSPLCDGALFTAGLEAAYRQMWRRWCAGEPATTFDVPASISR